MTEEKSLPLWDLKKRIVSSPCYLRGFLDSRGMTVQDCKEFMDGHAECIDDLLKNKPTDAKPFHCHTLWKGSFKKPSEGLQTASDFIPGTRFTKKCPRNPKSEGQRWIPGPLLLKEIENSHERSLVWRADYFSKNKGKVQEPSETIAGDDQEDVDLDDSTNSVLNGSMFDPAAFQANSTTFPGQSSSDESEPENQSAPRTKGVSFHPIAEVRPEIEKDKTTNQGLKPTPQPTEFELMRQQLLRQQQRMDQMQVASQEQAQESERNRREDAERMDRLTQEASNSHRNALRANQRSSGIAAFKDTTLDFAGGWAGDGGNNRNSGVGFLNGSWVPDVIDDGKVFGLKMACKPTPKPTSANQGLMKSSSSLAKNAQNDWLRTKNRQHDWLELQKLLLKNTVPYDATNFRSIFEYLEKEIKPFMQTEFHGLPLTTIAVLTASRFPHSQQRRILKIIDQVLEPFFDIESSYTEIRKKQTRFSARLNSTGDRLDYTDATSEEEKANVLEAQRVTEAVVFGDLFFEISHQMDPGTEIHFQTIEWQPDGLEELSRHFAELIFRDKLTSKKRDDVPITQEVTISCIWRCLEILFSSLHDHSTRMASFLLAELESEPRVKAFSNRRSTVKGTADELTGLIEALDEAHATAKQKMIRYKQRKIRSSSRQVKPFRPSGPHKAIMMNRELSGEDDSGEWIQEPEAIFKMSEDDDRRNPKTPAGDKFSGPKGKTNPEANKTRRRMEPRQHLVNKKYEKTSGNLMFNGGSSFEEERLRAIANWETIGEDLVAFQREIGSNSSDQEMRCLMINTRGADLRIEENPHFLKENPGWASEKFSTSPEVPVTGAEYAALALNANQDLYATLTSLPKVPLISVTVKAEDPTQGGALRSYDFRCLVDTGSSMNVIRFDVLQRMNLLDKKKKLEQDLVVQTCGNQVIMNSECYLDVKIGKLELGKQRFIVVPFEYLGTNGKMEGIIGTPALLQCGFSQFFKKWFQQMAGQKTDLSPGCVLSNEQKIKEESSSKIEKGDLAFENGSYEPIGPNIDSSVIGRNPGFRDNKRALNSETNTQLVTYLSEFNINPSNSDDGIFKIGAAMELKLKINSTEQVPEKKAAETTTQALFPAQAAFLRVHQNPEEPSQGIHSKEGSEGESLASSVPSIVGDFPPLESGMFDEDPAVAKFGPTECVYLPEVFSLVEPTAKPRHKNQNGSRARHETASLPKSVKPRMLGGIDRAAIIPSEGNDRTRRSGRNRPKYVFEPESEVASVTTETEAEHTTLPEAMTKCPENIQAAPRSTRPSLERVSDAVPIFHRGADVPIPCPGASHGDSTTEIPRCIESVLSQETWEVYLDKIGERPGVVTVTTEDVFAATTVFVETGQGKTDYSQPGPTTRELKKSWTDTTNRGSTSHPDRRTTVQNDRVSQTIAPITGSSNKRPTRPTKKVFSSLEKAGGSPGVCTGTLMHLLEEGLDSAQSFLPVNDSTPQEKEKALMMSLVHEVGDDNRLNFLKAVCFMNQQRDEMWAKQSMKSIREAIGGYRWAPRDEILTEQQVDARFPSGISLEAQESICVPKADVRDVVVAFPSQIQAEGLSYIITETLLKDPGMEVPSRVISTAGGRMTQLMVLNNSEEDVFIAKGSKVALAQAVGAISTSRLDLNNYVKHTSPLTDVKLAEIMGVLEQVYSKKLFEHSDISTLEAEAQQRYLELSKEVINPMDVLRTTQGEPVPPKSSSISEGLPLGSRPGPNVKNLSKTKNQLKEEISGRIREHILALYPEDDITPEQKYQILEQTNPMRVGDNLVTVEQNVVLNGLNAEVRRKLLAQLDSFEQARIEEFLNCIKDLPGDIVELLVNYAHRFYGDRNFNWEMIKSDKEIIQIPLRDTIPTTLSPNYIKKLASDELECINDFICSNLARGLLRKSRSNYINPILLVKKPNNRGYRICLDFRKANDEVFDSSSHQVPLIQDMILLMGNAELFSCFDVSNAYYRVELPEKYRKFCAFQVPKGPYTGLWEFCVLPFGVKPAVSIFSQVMDQALRGLQYKNVLWYLDDVLVYTEIPDKYRHLTGPARTLKLLQIHKEQIKLFLMRSTTYNLTYSIEKVAFLKRSIEFLGFVIGAGVIAPAPKTIAKLAAICEIGKVERPLKSWQRVLGFFNYCSANIPNFATQRKLIMKLHTKYHEFCSESKSVAKREKLRALAQPCIDGFLKYWCDCVEKGQLSIPPPNVPLRLYTDASVLSIGFVLTTLDHRVVWFSSRVLSEAEQNYSIEELEVLALYEGLVKTKVYSVRASDFICMLDNKNHIRAMLSYKTAYISDRAAKFLGKLRNYGKLNVRYVATDRQMADLLTRDVGDLENAGFEAVSEICKTTDPVSERIKQERKMLKAENKAAKEQEGIFTEDARLREERLKEETNIYSQIFSCQEATVTIEPDLFAKVQNSCFVDTVEKCLQDLDAAHEISYPRGWRAAVVEAKSPPTNFEGLFFNLESKFMGQSMSLKTILAEKDEIEHAKLVGLTKDLSDRDWLDKLWDPTSPEIRETQKAREKLWVTHKPETDQHIIAAIEPLEASSKWAGLSYQHFTKEQLVEIKSQPHRSTEEEQAQLAWWVHAIHFCRLKGRGLLKKLLLWFPGVAFTEKGVDEVTKSCQKCQLRRKLAPTNSIGHIEVPSAPFETISIDHFQYKSYTEGQYRYLLTIKDDFSKFVNFVPVRTKTMREVWVVLDTLFVVTGKPRVIRADNAFRTQEFLEWGATRNICLYFSPPYRPRSNGMVERVHVDINDLLPQVLAVMGKVPKDWLWGISMVAKCLNHTPSTTHGFAPEMVIKGFLTDERFIYTFTGKVHLMTMWEKIQERLKDKKKLYAKAHRARPENKLEKGRICFLKIPGKELETIEILIDLGSTVLANRLESHPVDRYKTLVFHKEFIYHKVVDCEANEAGSLSTPEHYVGFSQMAVGF